MTATPPPFDDRDSDWIDAAFAELVSELVDEAPVWPEARQEDPQPSEPGLGDTPPRNVPMGDAPAADVRAADLPAPGMSKGPDRVPVRPLAEESDFSLADGADEDEGHFVPPTPPPIRLPELPTLIAAIMAVCGLVIAVTPGLFRVSDSAGFPLGLSVSSAGLLWLFFRLREDSGREGWDDGSRL